METPTKSHYSSLVDTSRPFRSVKEAVQVFGERILVGEIYSPKPYSTPTPQDIKINTPSWLFSSPNPIKEYEIQHEHEHEDNNEEFFDTLKKIESELEETKMELKLLKERETETEIAVASLNDELHKNMSKLAEAEAKNAGATARKVTFQNEEKNRMESLDSSRLANILSNGEEKGFYGRAKEKKKMIKKKPIIPLVGEFLIFLRKKGTSSKSSTLKNTLCASGHGVF